MLQMSGLSVRLPLVDFPRYDMRSLMTEAASSADTERSQSGCREISLTTLASITGRRWKQTSMYMYILVITCQLKIFYGNSVSLYLPSNNGQNCNFASEALPETWQNVVSRRDYVNHHHVFGDASSLLTK